MTELAIKRALDESTRLEAVKIGESYFCTHITTNREVIITDRLDFSRIYAVISLDLYNVMTDDKERE